METPQKDSSLKCLFSNLFSRLAAAEGSEPRFMKEAEEEEEEESSEEEEELSPEEQGKHRHSFDFLCELIHMYKSVYLSAFSRTFSP